MRLGYVILYVPDVPKAAEFYHHAFGLKTRFVHESGSYAEMETGATALAFAQEEFTPTAGKFTLNRRENPTAGAEVGLVSANVEARYRIAVHHGAEPVVEPMLKPWGQTVAYVRDLNGFLVEICSEVQE